MNEVKKYKPIYFTYRYNFDFFLAKLAENAGVNFIQGYHAKDINFEKNSINNKNNNEIKACFIVGADGVNSFVARELFNEKFDKNKIAIAVETELPKEEFNREVELPEIYFGLIRYGYAWVFPKSKKLTIGIAGHCKYNKNIKDNFKFFLKDILKLPSDLNIKGHYIPFGHYRNNPGKDNVLLIGDAAGLVEPITGEGIAFAMQSGKFAAESIIEAKNNNNPKLAYSLYEKKYKNISNILDKANLLKHLIYPKFFNSLLIKGLAQPTSKSLVKNHLDLLADDITYAQYFTNLLKKSGKGLVKLIGS